SQQKSSQQVKGVHDGHPADHPAGLRPGSRHGELRAGHDGRAFGTGHADIDRSHGTAVLRLGPGHTGDGDPVRRAERVPHARRHRRGHVPAHGPLTRPTLRPAAHPPDAPSPRRFTSVAYATTPPANVADDPGIPVSSAPIRPPVSDSAVATVAERSASSRWTTRSSVSSSAPYTAGPSSSRTRASTPASRSAASSPATEIRIFTSAGSGR